MKATLSTKGSWCAAMALGVSMTAFGCLNTQPDRTPLTQGPVPLRERSPARPPGCVSYEDSLTGGQLFSMYCSQCHNARPLSERPFSNYRNAVAHMRVRANLTGKECAKITEFLARWHDQPPPHPPIDGSPKRFIFGQPIAEQKDQTAPLQPPGNPGLPPHMAQNTLGPAYEGSPALRSVSGQQ
jgi:hypothetical protein